MCQLKEFLKLEESQSREAPQVVLFQLKECGHPQDDVMPNFFLILKALYEGFQMRYHLYLNFFKKVVKIAPTGSLWPTLYLLCFLSNTQIEYYELLSNIEITFFNRHSL